MEKFNFIGYDYQDKELIYYTPNYNIFHKIPTQAVWLLLMKIYDDDFKVTDEDIVALNRFLMNKSDDLDYSTCKSQQQRTVLFTPELKVELAQRLGLKVLRK